MHLFLDFLFSLQKLEGEAQFVLSCSWLGPNIEQVIETLTFVETKQEKKITDKCHTVKNAEIPAEVIIKMINTE